VDALEGHLYEPVLSESLTFVLLSSFSLETDWAIKHDEAIGGEGDVQPKSATMVSRFLPGTDASHMASGTTTMARAGKTLRKVMYRIRRPRVL
jgi:hypothetical protein